MKTRTIKVDYLARVEGEGAFHLKIKDNKIEEAHLKIFEPPRFFEAFLRGRNFLEAPDITARICGICPVAYMMSAAHAMEDAVGAVIPEEIRLLRRLLYCGEWLESHVLHMVMLHAPDFLGYQSAIEMAKDYGNFVQMGLRIKRAGNEIVSTLGGREIHPINVRVGGFYKIPVQAKLDKLKDTLKIAREELLELMTWMSSFEFMDYERPYLYVSTSHESEYPFNEGRIISSEGLNIPIQNYENHFSEVHVKYTNALQSFYEKDRSYFVGPMARYNLNYNKLSDLAKETAKGVGLGKTCHNPFKSLLIRGVESVYAFDEAIRILDTVKTIKLPFVDVRPREGIGFGCTEAPRGMLWHRYKIASNGDILEAKIVPPTSQNQSTIEEDLIGVAQANLHLPDEELKWFCEQTIRNYDPCISCATHFLKLDIERS